MLQWERNSGTSELKQHHISLRDNTGRQCHSLGHLQLVIFLCEQNYMWGSFICCILLHVYQATEMYFFNTALYVWLLMEKIKQSKDQHTVVTWVTPSCTLAANCCTKYTATYIICNSNINNRSQVYAFNTYPITPI